MDDDVKIQLRLRRKRLEPQAKVRTFKDLHARERQAGSSAGRTPTAVTPQAVGHGAGATGSQGGQDIVINHVLV